MSSTKIRHLVEKPGARGAPPRFYWQPADDLRGGGWASRRLMRPDGAPVTDRTEAAAAAEALNAEVDAWRRGETPKHGAVGQRPPIPAGTVAALIEEYKLSRWWRKLRPSTQQHYGWALDAIRAWAGDLPVRAVTAPAVQAFYAAQSRRAEGTGKARRVIHTPAKGAAAVRVLRLLLQVGVRLGYLPVNPAANPGLEVRRQREPVIWSPEALAHMVATADALGWRSIGTAILLNEWLGQRQADIRKLPPWSAETGALVFRQGKTGRRVSLPVHLVPHLVDRLRGEAQRPGAVASLTHLLLHEGTRKEWRLHTFSHVFAEIRAQAAQSMPCCADLRFAELRHTAVTRLHEAQVDELGISGITGHSPATVKEVLEKHYLVRTAKAAEGAFRKRLAAETAKVGQG